MINVFNLQEHVIDLPQNSYVSFNSSAQRYDLAVSWKTEGVVKANNSVIIRLAFDERIYFVEFVEIIHVDEVEGKSFKFLRSTF